MLPAVMISDGSSVDEFLCLSFCNGFFFGLIYVFSRVSLFQSLSDPLSLYSVWDISNCFIVLIPFSFSFTFFFSFLDLFFIYYLPFF